MNELAGWIPTRFVEDEEGKLTRLEWYKRKNFRFSEPFFHLTMAKHEVHLEKKTTEAEELLNYFTELPLPNPAGFIFHLTRCGSTMISQMLAQDPLNLVLSEPVVAEQVLDFKHLPMPKRIAMFIGAMRAYSAIMEHPEKRLFIKLANEELLPWLSTIYPDTPWIFVFRDPEEIIHSNLTRQPLWLRKIIDDKDKQKFLFEKLNYQMKMTLKHAGAAALLVQYEDIDLNFPKKLLQAFGLPYSTELELKMKQSLDWYSKANGVSWKDWLSAQGSLSSLAVQGSGIEIPESLAIYYRELQKLKPPSYQE